MVERNVNPQQNRNAAAEANPLPPSGGVRSALDTGMPGFDVAGRVYTFDPGDPDREDTPPLADRGMIPPDDNIPYKKDLSKTTKDTLARYLSSQTTVNRFPITAPEPNPWVPTVVVSPNGNQTPSLPPTTEPTKNGRWFTQGLASFDGTTKSPSDGMRGWRPVETFTTIDSALGPEPEQLDIKKGKDPRGNPDLDGNSLLSRAPVSELRKVPNAVLKNNRFSSSSRYASTPEGGISFGGGEAVQTSPRSFDPSAYNQAQYHPAYGEVSIDSLAGIAQKLMGRATGDFSFEVSGETAAIKKVELVKLEAQDAIKTILAEGAAAPNFTNINNGSWGSLTNVDNYFDGLSSVGIKAVAVALSTSVFYLAEVLLRVIDAFVKDNEGFDPNSESYVAGLKLGSSRISAARGKTNKTEWYWDVLYDITGFFGILPTKNTYTTAVYEGISALFGRKSSSFFKNFGVEMPPELELFAGSAEFATTAPGYVLVLSRAFLRSLVTFQDSFGQLMSSSRVTEEKIVDGVKLFSESKMIKILNALAAMGDGIITNEEYQKGVQEAGSNAFDVHSVKLKKDFRSGDLRGSTWASNSSPSLYLIPDSVTNLSLIYNSTLGASSLPPTPSAASFSTFTASISKFESEAIETVLDAAYVPFYFHDLRTNEIISFHAFLDSLSDSFSVSYESAEGFGRVEPVKIYKGTTRSISINFYIAALNKSDFDDMWFKINKLVTLIYPQYTEGRKLVNGNYRFTQPFSQMVGASPLIRIRLGELFHSNYSRFALARLFGATLSDTTYIKDLNAAVSASNPSQAGPTVTFEEIKDRAIQKEEYFFPSSDSLTMYNTSKGGSTVDIKDARFYLPFKFTEVKPDGTVKAQFIGWDQLRAFWTKVKMSPGPNWTQQTFAPLKSKYGKKNSSNYFDENTEFFGVLDGFYLPIKTESDIRAEIAREKLEDFAQGNRLLDLDDFMKPENNAVVKSFESAGGKGLAGVIESLSFDWLENFTWETTVPGAKAPKMCRVQLSFSPIHDISPGIDSQGYNRAPVYPVRMR